MNVGRKFIPLLSCSTFQFYAFVYNFKYAAVTWFSKISIKIHISRSFLCFIDFHDYSSFFFRPSFFSSKAILVLSIRSMCRAKGCNGIEKEDTRWKSEVQFINNIRSHFRHSVHHCKDDRKQLVHLNTTISEATHRDYLLYVLYMYINTW